MNWQFKPTKIEKWTSDIDYAMFIDENGNDSKIKFILKNIEDCKEIDENDRYYWMYF